MKVLARQYFRWPNLDNDLETYFKNCAICNKWASNPNKAELIPYDQSREVLERIHLDYLGPFNGKFYLVIIDSFLKSPEVYAATRIDSENTVNKLRDFCSRYGLPKKIVSDNGKQLISSEFERFCEANGIKHNTTAPYHSSSNGAAENVVKSFKIGLKKALSDPKNEKESMETLVSRYLQAPSQLMYNRHLRTRLDLLTSNHKEQSAKRQVKNYGGNRRVKRLPKPE